jgi:hypothetical protein
MPFEIDILIVFADADNKAPSDGTAGWVSQFKKFLEFMLVQVVDDKPKILLKGEFETMTSPRLDNVGLLIPVLSREFMASSACLENLETFYRAANYDSSRILKVVKDPVLVHDQPQFLQPLLGYEMYQLDLDSGEVREYQSYFSTEAQRQYWMEIVDLSHDIARLLHKSKNGISDNQVKDLFKPKMVYLAETGHDLSVERNIIMREIQRYGYTVLPDKSLSGDTLTIEQVVRRDLEACSMSIHLIGNTYGEVPDGGTQSIMDIQNRIAAEKSHEAKKRNESFGRLIWIAPAVIHMNESQKRFIETIKRDVEVQEGAEILETPLEHFKNIIREELLEAKDRKSIKETGGRAVYLLHDKEDTQEVRPYVELMEKSGFHVLMPGFEGELLEQRRKHIENLRALDAAIIYKGKGNEQWVRMKASDIAKAPGFGRKKPIVAKAILSAPGDISNGHDFKIQDFRLIEGDSKYFIESLKSFLQEFGI